MRMTRHFLLLRHVSAADPDPLQTKSRKPQICSGDVVFPKRGRSLPIKVLVYGSPLAIS